ncbi:MAG: TldD/PmbA family protein [Clostridia bacterium]|jgi:PmbA protein|nr:TldD/PmbA family protein [Clostridia bacterium]MBP6949893.1 TldD/PmbA family protein [Clostridia bacterium]
MRSMEKMAQLGLSALREGGADRAVCTVSRTVMRELTAEWGEFSLYRTIFDDSVGYMAIIGGRRGVLSQNTVNKDAIREGAANCLKSAQAADPDEAWQLAPPLPEQLFETGPLTCAEERLFERCEEFLADIRARFPLISVWSLVATHTLRKGVSLYSTGSRFFSRRGVYSVDLLFNATEEEATSSFFSTSAEMLDLDTPFIELGSFESDLAAISRQVFTKAMDDKFTGTVLLTPDCFGDLLAACIGTYASDGVILDGTSLWREKIGQQVANEKLSLKLAPLHPDIVAGQRYTSEGYLAEDYYLIERGTLNQFHLSDYAARKTGHRRAPTSSLGSFIVEPGEESLETMIRGIARGLVVARLSAGAPSVSGDFSGVAKNCFLIEKGEIKEALSETMVNGNLAEFLMNIKALSKEVVKDGSSVLPWVAIEGVGIAGK